MAGNHPDERTLNRVRNVVEQRREDGADYLKASQIQRDLDNVSRSAIGMALRALYDAGEIGAWNLEGDRATTWRISGGDTEIGDGDVVPNGLAPTFRALDLNGPCTIDDLHSVTGKDHSTLNQHCLKLLQAGVVVRRRPDDRTTGKAPYEYRVADTQTSVATESMQRTADTPWRQRCPKGHASITNYSDTFACGACERTYDGDPYDAKHTDFPVDVDPCAKDIHDEVLHELVRECEDPTTTCKRAYQLSAGTPNQVGRILAELEQDGLVERLGTGANNGHRWRPTDAGVQAVIETERTIALEAGSKRQRAQIEPVMTGLATLFVGMVLGAGYAIATAGVAL